MKFIIFALAIAVTACSSSKLVIPSGKSENDYYADQNACEAEARRAVGDEWAPRTTYTENCMLAKGYRWSKSKSK